MMGSFGYLDLLHSGIWTTLFDFTWCSVKSYCTQWKRLFF